MRQGAVDVLHKRARSAALILVVTHRMRRKPLCTTFLEKWVKELVSYCKRMVLPCSFSLLFAGWLINLFLLFSRVVRCSASKYWVGHQVVHVWLWQIFWAYDRELSLKGGEVLLINKSKKVHHLPLDRTLSDVAPDMLCIRIQSQSIEVAVDGSLEIHGVLMS